jgi:hypothetical protein
MRTFSDYTVHVPAHIPVCAREFVLGYNAATYLVRDKNCITGYYWKVHTQCVNEIFHCSFIIIGLKEKVAEPYGQAVYHCDINGLSYATQGSYQIETLFYGDKRFSPFLAMCFDSSLHLRVGCAGCRDESLPSIPGFVSALQREAALSTTGAPGY